MFFSLVSFGFAAFAVCLCLCRVATFAFNFSSFTGSPTPHPPLLPHPLPHCGPLFYPSLPPTSSTLPPVTTAVSMSVLLRIFLACFCCCCLLILMLLLLLMLLLVLMLMLVLVLRQLLISFWPFCHFCYAAFFETCQKPSRATQKRASNTTTTTTATALATATATASSTTTTSTTETGSQEKLGRVIFLTLMMRDSLGASRDNAAEKKNERNKRHTRKQIMEQLSYYIYCCVAPSTLLHASAPNIHN